MSHASQHLEAKIEAILAAFANAEEHIVPEQALADAHDHQQALIPHLQQAVIQAHALSAAGRLQAEGDWRLPVFALHLLAAWRVPGTYDLLWQSLMLDDRYDSRWLMADAYMEWPHLLITTFDGDVDRLFRILWQNDPPWYSDLCLCSTMVLASAHHHHLGDRAVIKAGFAKMLDTCDDEMVLGTLMIFIARLKLAHLLPRLWQVLKTQRGQRAMTRLDVEEALASPWREGFAVSNPTPNPINHPREDLLAIIRGWQYFKPPLPQSKRRDREESPTYQYEKRVHDFTSRPGAFILPKRTLPCDCDSGLPYGACCGQK